MKPVAMITATIAIAAPAQAYIATAHTGTHCNGESLGQVENRNDRCIDLKHFIDGYTNTASFYIELDVESPQDRFQFLKGGCLNNEVLYERQGAGCIPVHSQGLPDIMWKRSA